MAKLFPHELFVAPSVGEDTAPTVLMAVKRDGHLVLGRMEVMETLTPEQVQDRYGWATPIWHYAAMEGDRERLGEDDVPAELCAQDAPPEETGRVYAFNKLVRAFRRREGGDAA